MSSGQNSADAALFKRSDSSEIDTPFATNHPVKKIEENIIKKKSQKRERSPGLAI